MSFAQENQYFSYPEAAELLNVSHEGLSRWLNNHIEIKEKYVSKKKHNGRRRLVIASEAIPVIANMRDNNRGNQYAKNELSTKNVQFKKELAERAVEQTKQVNLPAAQNIEQLKTALMQAMVASQAALESLELATRNTERIEDHDQRLSLLEGDTSSLPITEGQKKVLNERIRKLAFERQIHFSQVWTQLHELVGKRSITEYVMEDYFVAITVIKKWYKMYGIMV